MESLSVALGSRSYPIHVGAGLLDRRELYAPYLRGSAAIVTNKVVAPLYLQRDPLYREVADLVVDTGRQSVQTLARAIIDQLAVRWKASA